MLAWLTPVREQLQHVVTYLGRLQEAVAGTTVAAAQFFQDPNEWLECWGPWLGRRRSVPCRVCRASSTSTRKHGRMWCIWTVASSFRSCLSCRSGRRVFWCRCSGGTVRPASRGSWMMKRCLPALCLGMLELGTRLGLQYRVEYHKLEYEELERRIHFAQHCNSVRGACVLLHKRSAPETEV